jgi:hypothetical protein
LFARFVRHDSTVENMKLLWSYLEKFGRPLAFYITAQDRLVKGMRVAGVKSIEQANQISGGGLSGVVGARADGRAGP